MFYFLKQIKYGWQKYKRGWSDEDVWDFDSYLTGIIIPALKRLKENHVGCPGDLWDEKVKNNECHKWQEILEEMIQGFKACEEIDKPSWIKGGFRREVDIKRLDVLEKKYKRGMELFCRYYRNLWD